MTELTIGFSTCPNDTFIFDALVNGKIPDHGVRYKPFLADVEELNKLAMKGELDITKLSYHAAGYVRDRYCILNSGGALGYGNGPLLVSALPPDELNVNTSRIGIPGRYTTANLLMGIAWPEAVNKTEFLFSDMEEAILSEQVDAGVLIHETRFTYAEKGLHLIMDLGDYWERKTGLPIPLGGIMIRRSLDRDLQHTVQEAIARSLQYATEHPSAPLDYMLKYAQEMREEILRMHVSTFVNEFSHDLGYEGQRAVSELFRLGEQAHLFPEFSGDLFV